MFTICKRKITLVSLFVICSLMISSCGNKESSSSSVYASSEIDENQKKANELSNLMYDSNRQGGFYSLFGYSFKDGNSSKYLSVDSSMNLVEDSTGWAFTGFTYGPDGDFGLECYSPDSPLDAHYVCLDSDSGLLFASSDKSKAALFKGADFSGEFSLEAFSSSSDWVGETKKIGMSSSGKISSSQTPIVWECSLYNSAIGKEYQGKEAKEDWPICPSLGNLMDDVIVNGVTTHKENDPIYECKKINGNQVLRMTVKRQDSPSFYIDDSGNIRKIISTSKEKDLLSEYNTPKTILDLLIDAFKSNKYMHIQSSLINTDVKDYDSAANFFTNFGIWEGAYDLPRETLSKHQNLNITKKDTYLWEEDIASFYPAFIREFSMFNGKTVCTKEFLVFIPDDGIFESFSNEFSQVEKHVQANNKYYYSYVDSSLRVTELN